MLRALVTGGSGDIGGAICRRLASEGMHVIVHASRNRCKAETLCEELANAGYSGEPACFDVTDRAAVNAALQRILETGPVQVLVNNAGIHDDVPFAGMSPEQWQRVVDVSLNGFYNVTQPLIMPMMRGRWGRIISLSSIAGIAGNRGQVNYAAAKAALHGATRSLAQEVASRGITVNVVAPGIIGGGMAASAFDAETIRRIVPMKRAGRPDEVAALVAFLASSEAGYISGQVIAINGAVPTGAA